MVMNEGIKKQIKDKAVSEFDALVGAYLDVMNKRALKGEYTQQDIKKDWNDTVSEAEWIIKDVAQAAVDVIDVQLYDEPVENRNSKKEDNEEIIDDNYDNYESYDNSNDYNCYEDKY